MSVDLAGLACCALLLVAGYVVAVVPVVRNERRVSDLRVQIFSSEKRVGELLHRARELEQTLGGVQDRLDESSLSLEPAERVNRRVNTLTHKASASGLSLDEVKPRDAETGALYRTVPIRITGKGTYPQVANFLHRLRTELRDTTVRSLQIVNDPTGQAPPSFVFELVWFAAPADRAG